MGNQETEYVRAGVTTYCCGCKYEEKSEADQKHGIASILSLLRHKQLLNRHNACYAKETLNKGGPALLADLNLIRETTSHDFPA